MADFKQRSNIILAKDEDEYLKLKRKANIYAFIGLLSLFGFLACIGFTIYMFLNDVGDPLPYSAVSIILFLIQKYVGNKHDEIVK